MNKGAAYVCQLASLARMIAGYNQRSTDRQPRCVPDVSRKFGRRVSNTPFPARRHRPLPSLRPRWIQRISGFCLRRSRTCCSQRKRLASYLILLTGKCIARSSPRFLTHTTSQQIPRWGRTVDEVGRDHLGRQLRKCVLRRNGVCRANCTS